jgi:hypothetical protein
MDFFGTKFCFFGAGLLSFGTLCVEHKEWEWFFKNHFENSLSSIENVA